MKDMAEFKFWINKMKRKIVKMKCISINTKLFWRIQKKITTWNIKINCINPLEFWKIQKSINLEMQEKKIHKNSKNKNKIYMCVWRERERENYA